MRIDTCADCQKAVPYGSIMFAVYWSVDAEEPTLYYICVDCAQNHVRENYIPGGRV